MRQSPTRKHTNHLWCHMQQRVERHKQSKRAAERHEMMSWQTNKEIWALKQDLKRAGWDNATVLFQTPERFLYCRKRCFVFLFFFILTKIWPCKEPNDCSCLHVSKVELFYIFRQLHLESVSLFKKQFCHIWSCYCDIMENRDYVRKPEFHLVWYFDKIHLINDVVDQCHWNNFKMYQEPFL